MKKFYLLFTVILLLVIGIVKSSAVVVTIGTGTSETAYPFATLYEDGKCEILYTAAEITAGGGSAGDVTSISLNVSDVSVGVVNGFQIKIKHTTASSVTGFTSTGWTTVYNSNVSLSVDGWKELTFSTPFAWDGTSNIALQMCFNNDDWSGDSWVYATSTPSMMWAYRDDGVDGCTLTGGSSLSYRPNIKFDITSTAPMLYTDFDTLQVPKTPISRNSTNNLIGAVAINTSGTLTPYYLKRVVFSNAGTATSADLQNVKVWKNNALFLDTDPTKLFGSNATINTGFNTVTRSSGSSNIELISGANVIFFTYDVKADATLGNIADLKIDTIVLAKGNVETPVVVNTNTDGARTIKEALIGEYTIGGPVQATKYFATFQEAISELGSLGISGNVDFAIADNLTLPTGTPVVLTSFNSLGGNHSVTIYPKNVARTITGNYAGTGSMFTIAGADRIIIDGRVNKTGDARGLTFKNNSTEADNRHILIIGDDATNGGSDDITIKYVNFEGSNKDAELGTSIYIAGSGNGNNSIVHSKFTKVDYAFRVVASTEATVPAATNLKINNNIFGDEVLANSLGRLAGYFRNIHQFEMNDNIIQNIINSTSYVVPIYLDADIQDAKISRNRISNIAGNTLSIPIYSYKSTNQNIVIDNNTMTQISGRNSHYGIYIYEGSNIGIYHNTIVMEGNRDAVAPGSDPTTASAVINAGSTASGIKIKNNILINSLTTTSTNNAYIYFSSSNTAIEESDYNNFYLDASNSVFASVSGTLSNNFVNWQTNSTLDENSKNVSVELTSDKHLSGASALSTDLLVPVLDIPGISNDIDNLPRHAFPGTTQMGADDATPILTLTQDLTKEISGLCAPLEQVLTVQAAVTGFTDGINRTVTNPPFIYNWKLDGNHVDNVQYNIDENGDLVETTVNSNVFTARIETATPPDGINYKVDITCAGGTLTSNTTNIKSEQNIVITEPLMETAELCTENGVTTLTVEATGTITGYQWQKEIDGTWTNLDGETNNSVEVVLASPKFGPGKYKVIIYDGENNCNNGQVESNISTLTSVDPLRNLVLTSPVLENGKIELCERANYKLSVDKELLTGDVFGFRWEQFENDVWTTVNLEKHPEMSIDGIDFSIAVPEHSGTFRLVLIGSSLCDTKELASDAIEVVIKPFVKVLNQPRAQIVCKDNPIVLEVKAEGENATYQWTKDGKPITAEENATFDKPVFKIENADFEDSGVYGVMVKVLGCVPGRDDGVLVSEPATVYVMNETQIISQPVNQHAILGKRAIFEVRTNAIGAAPDYIADFQWFNGNQELEDNAKYAGAKSSVLVINYAEASDATAEYHLRIKGLCGDYLYTDKVHIIPATVAFTEQLSDVIACENELVTYKVAAETTYPNEEITFEWHFVNSEGTDQVLPSSTSNEISILAIEANAGKYYALAKLLNDGASVKSNESLLKVNTKPVITEAFEAATVAANESFTLTVLASGNDLEYKWYRDGAIIANAVSASFTGQEANAGTYDYRVEVINSCGTVSTAADVTVTAEPKVEVIEPILGVFVSNVIPNPVVSSTASFTVNSDKAYQMTVSLIDAAGRNYGTLFDGTLSSSQEVTFNVNELTSGAYYLNININGKVITRQIIVSK